MNIAAKIAEELSIKEWQTEAVIKLIDEGNTIPFIARYRKEAHGTLNDEQLRKLYERLCYLRNLEERREAVLRLIDAQGKLDDMLKEKILQAETLVDIEDLYRPYKQKKRTRAVMAKEKGLEPLADLIYMQKTDSVTKEAEKFIDAEKGVNSVEEAISGAKDILAEMISDNADYRTYIRNKTRAKGFIDVSARDENEKTVYENYYGFHECLNKLAGYKVLAINRGEKEKILVVKTEAPAEEIITYLSRKIIRKDVGECGKILLEAIKDAYDRLISPAIEREIRNELTESAEENAIGVFGKNLTQLLMQPPISGKTVLGWDPAFRTGCKLAVVDKTGKVLDTRVIYPTAPTNEKKIRDAKETVKALIKKYNINLISIGNGTASRESEQIVVELLSEIKEDVSYVITNEAGASVYSASELATEEFPEFDVGQRSAASIARRVQDPLSELVKIDPKSIGVGQYQHDMNQKKLGEALSGVVEDCVNNVGVDLNTASAPLMQYISGISKTVAGNIVAYREENGSFTDRKQLLKVSKLGPKAYEQCAGFMRISNGKNPLDNTGVHPESYDAVKKLLKEIGIPPEELKTGCKIEIKDYAEMAKKLGIGEPTLRDIVREIEKPGRDPRDMMPPPVLRKDVLAIEDLREGMILKGTVRNVIDFGAFVDIGVHQDGLVHISKLTKEKFVKHPLDVVSVGDIVEVKVLSVDVERKRISLSMI